MGRSEEIKIWSIKGIIGIIYLYMDDNGNFKKPISMGTLYLESLYSFGWEPWMFNPKYNCKKNRVLQNIIIVKRGLVNNGSETPVESKPKIVT